MASAIPVINEIHYGFAFLVLLCALLLGWVQLGRRVMIALIGVQFLIGLVYAGLLGKATPPDVLWHVLGAVLATVAYVAGRRLGDRSASPAVPIALSLLGLLLLVGTAWVGLHMHSMTAHA